MKFIIPFIFLTLNSAFAFSLPHKRAQYEIIFHAQNLTAEVFLKKIQEFAPTLDWKSKLPFDFNDEVVFYFDLSVTEFMKFNICFTRIPNSNNFLTYFHFWGDGSKKFNYDYKTETYLKEKLHQIFPSEKFKFKPSNFTGHSCEKVDYIQWPKNTF